MRLLAVLLCLFLSACDAERWPPPGTPTISPIDFFEGRTAGRGVLKIAFRSPQDVHVESVGTRAPDGVLTVRQNIRQGDKAPRVREWRLREVAAGRYEGSLTDAVGPVLAQANANSLRLRYEMKGGFEVDQWLVFAHDGRSANNMMRIRKLGVIVGRLDETIRKLD